MNQIKHPIRVFLKKPQLRTLEKGTLGYDSHLAFRFFFHHIKIKFHILHSKILEEKVRKAATYLRAKALKCAAMVAM